ncbi:MAG TPA: hypothetical protein VJY33_22485 [Isosphaeraceae bacterium]|nr:hypothetical protein [Isosphaeraceae bacterium]
MSEHSNGPPADGPATDLLLTRERAFNPPPPSAKSRVKTNRVQVRDKRASYGGECVAWLDLEKCKFKGSQIGRHQRQDWERLGVCDWEELFITPDGRFFVHIKTIKIKPPHEMVESYAVEITDLEVVRWFADDPESAPEPLVEKFDVTEAPMMDSTPDDLFDQLIRQAGRLGIQAGRVQFAVESYLELIDQEDPDELYELAATPADRPELAAVPPSENETASTNGRTSEAPAKLSDLVTLDQAAALVNRSARTLERYKKLGMPRPFVLGGGGKPHEYPLDEMRKWLQKTFNRPIPEAAIQRYRHPKTI